MQSGAKILNRVEAVQACYQQGIKLCYKHLLNARRFICKAIVLTQFLVFV